MRTMADLNVVVCGGGRTGHLSAVLFKQVPGVRVSLLTANKAAVAAYRQRGVLTARLPSGLVQAASPDAFCSEPAAALSDADIVIVTLPSQARPAFLASLAPHLPTDKPVYVGAIPGFCGFDWLAGQALATRPNAVIWGMKDVPHIAFDLEPGVAVRMGGAKSALYVATHARESHAARAALLGHLRRLYTATVALLHDYLEITLTPGNPIMHSAVIFGLIGPYAQWHDRPIPQRLCWWSECPELGAYFLERSDEENQRLCRAAETRLGVDLSSVKPLRQEIIEAYGGQIADPATMLSLLRTNRAYDAIEAPLVPASGGHGYVIDKTDRAFHEDVAYGLSLLVEMGRRLDVPLPYIEEIFAWNVSYMGGLRGSALDYFPEAWPQRRPYDTDSNTNP